MSTVKEVKQETSKPNPSLMISDSMKEIKYLIRARTPLIYVVTHEEVRFIQEFHKTVAEDSDIRYSLYTWTGYQGLVTFEQREKFRRADDSGDSQFAKTQRPDKALQLISTLRHDKSKNQKGMAFIMQDLHTLFTPPIIRQIRDMIDHLSNSNKTLIITSPIVGGKGQGLPSELEKDISLVYYNLPTRKVLRAVATEYMGNIHTSIQERATEEGKDSKYASMNTDYEEDEMTDIASSGQGLTIPEFSNALASSFVRFNRIVPSHILSEKKHIIKKSAILDYIDTDVALEDIGGMDVAKHYLRRYSKSFSDEAKAFGVDAPEGFLFTGVPGTGKSLLAKAVANLWKIPLLRLDIGKVMTGLVGGSEEKMRQAIQAAEAMSPCVLWIDEVEKAVGGVKSSHQSDSGTLSRVFGTLLTWMQEKKVEVPVVATANDFQLLPPEFIRRFSETLFVDLPTDEEREQIWKIHISKARANHKGRDPKKYNIDKLVQKSLYYTGAEIEKCVKGALAAAFAAGDKKVTNQHLLTAIDETQPLYKVKGEKVQELRREARGRFIYASSGAKQEADIGKQSIKTTGGSTMSIDEIDEDLGKITLESKDKKSKSKATN